MFAPFVRVSLRGVCKSGIMFAVTSCPYVLFIYSPGALLVRPSDLPPRPAPLPIKESCLVYCTPLYSSSSSTSCFTLEVCVVCSDPSSHLLFAFNSDSYAKTEKIPSLKGKIHPLCFILTGVKLDLFLNML